MCTLLPSLAPTTAVLRSLPGIRSAPLIKGHPVLGGRHFSRHSCSYWTVHATAAMSETVVQAPDVYHLGLDTLRVPRGALHSKTRKQVLDKLRSKLPVDEQGIVVVKGGESKNYYDTDSEPVFRQESYFHYLFGVTEPDWFGAIDVKTGESVLFAPRLPESFAVWMGPLKTLDEHKATHGVDRVHFVDEMSSILEKMNGNCLHVLQGRNTDSGADYPPCAFEGIEKFKVDKENLYSVARESRVTKIPEEVEVLRYSNRIGASAHVAMLHACKPGMMEYQLEAVYLNSCYSKGGSRLPAYTPIAASGPNPAILHYGHAGCPNNRQMQDGDMVLCDMGCKYYGYDSDITMTFPVNGKFTENQKLIYETVLRARTEVEAAMKPGVSWLDMHKLAEHVILSGLKNGGLLKGDVDEMMDKFMGAVFMPHGLGHLLGLETHDVGGYPEGGPVRSTEPGRKNLRTARVLEAGMVLTVEPGCYFNPVLINAAMQNDDTKDFFVPSRMEEFKGFGGVRIEDNVLVTSNGIENFTNVPRTVDEIECVMAGGEWA